MIAPGYYTQECNSQKKCEKGKYCHMFLCVDCLKENVACTQNGQCCVDQGLFCVYGRCKAGASKGAAGRCRQTILMTVALSVVCIGKKLFRWPQNDMTSSFTRLGLFQIRQSTYINYVHKFM